MMATFQPVLTEPRTRILAMSFEYRANSRDMLLYEEFRAPVSLRAGLAYAASVQAEFRLPTYSHAGCLSLRSRFALQPPTAPATPGMPSRAATPGRIISARRLHSPGAMTISIISNEFRLSRRA